MSPEYSDNFLHFGDFVKIFTNNSLRDDYDLSLVCGQDNITEIFTIAINSETYIICNSKPASYKPLFQYILFIHFQAVQMIDFYMKFRAQFVILSVEEILQLLFSLLPVNQQQTRDVNKQELQYSRLQYTGAA